MLNIFFGNMPEAIYNTSVYFKNVYLEEWFEDPFVQKMIKSVDQAEVLGPNAIKSKVMGVIPPTGLSGGVKALILMYYCDDIVCNASNCGDNCAKWILKIANKKDLTINLRHIMEFGDSNFDAVVLNNHELVHGMGELVDVAIDYL